MKILKELSIIFGILFAAHIIREVTNFPIPATVFGMLILLFLLIIGIVKIDSISAVTNFFLDNLMFFFIPGGVGLITSLNLLKGQWMKIILIVILTTIIAMAATGITVQFLKGRRKEVKE